MALPRLRKRSIAADLGLAASPRWGGNVGKTPVAPEFPRSSDRPRHVWKMKRRSLRRGSVDDFLQPPITASGAVGRRSGFDHASRRGHPTCPPARGRERDTRCGRCRSSWAGKRTRPYGVAQDRTAGRATLHQEKRQFFRLRRARLRTSGASSTSCSRSARSHASLAEPRRELGPCRTR